jgi:hypothetical protein
MGGKEVNEVTKEGKWRKEKKEGRTVGRRAVVGPPCRTLCVGDCRDGTAPL